MKRNHENITLIEEWLIKNSIEPSLDDDFVRNLYDDVLEDLYELKNTISRKTRRRGYSLQYDFVRRDLLKIIHKRNEYSINGISAGYVYAIGNPAWKDYIKIGSAIDVDDRLKSYQTSSPLRDFFIIDYYFVLNRREEESLLHSIFSDRKLEWCKVDKDRIKEIFRKRKEERIVRPTLDKIWYHQDRINSLISVNDKSWYRILNVEDDVQ